MMFISVWVLIASACVLCSDSGFGSATLSGTSRSLIDHRGMSRARRVRGVTSPSELVSEQGQLDTNGSKPGLIRSDDLG